MTEIVVTAKVSDPMKAGFQSGGFSADHYSALIMNYQFNANFSSFGPTDTTLSAIDLVANTCKALGAIIAGATKIAAPALPASEETRLTALADALEAAADGLQAGKLDLDSARDLVKSSLAVFLDLAGGAGVGVFMAAVATYVTSITPLPPHVEAAMIGGSGVLGALMEITLGNSGLYDKVAGLLTDGLFEGAQSLVYALDKIVTGVSQATNPFDFTPYEPLNLDYFDLSPGSDDINGIDPTYSNFAAFDGPASYFQVEVAYITSNSRGGETDPDIIHSRAGTDLLIDYLIV